MMRKDYPTEVDRSHNWKADHQSLWKRLVPGSGQATSLQGELIRLVGKLNDEAFRNANANFDGRHEQLWKFVAKSLVAYAEDFSLAELELIPQATEEIIANSKRFPPAEGQGTAYYFLAKMVVKFCRAHADEIPFRAPADYPTRL